MLQTFWRPGTLWLLVLNSLLFQVRWAVQNSVPFVTKSGGHSTWSTIGSEGFIIDLSNYSGITVDSLGLVAKLKGSILTKAVAVHLAEAGYFAGNSTQVSPAHIQGSYN